MKLKQVAEDDPSAEFEITFGGGSAGLRKQINQFGPQSHTVFLVEPKEKSNAEIANEMVCGSCGFFDSENRYVSVNNLIKKLLDATDEKIEKAVGK